MQTEKEVVDFPQPLLSLKQRQFVPGSLHWSGAKNIIRLCEYGRMSEIYLLMR